MGSVVVRSDVADVVDAADDPVLARSFVAARNKAKQSEEMLRKAESRFYEKYGRLGYAFARAIGAAELPRRKSEWQAFADEVVKGWRDMRRLAAVEGLDLESVLDSIAKADAAEREAAMDGQERWREVPAETIGPTLVRSSAQAGGASSA